MTNEIILKGKIRDIRKSHVIEGVQFDQAVIDVPGSNGRDSSIILKFKHECLKNKEGDYVELVGNIRSHSTKHESGKNRVEIFVFTYFDKPDPEIKRSNQVIISGRICKTDIIREFMSNSRNYHITLANNIITERVKLNSYVPCVFWNSLADVVSKKEVGDIITIYGELRSREFYKEGKIFKAYELLGIKIADGEE